MKLAQRRLCNAASTLVEQLQPLTRTVGAKDQRSKWVNYFAVLSASSTDSSAIWIRKINSAAGLAWN